MEQPIGYNYSDQDCLLRLIYKYPEISVSAPGKDHLLLVIRKDDKMFYLDPEALFCWEEATTYIERFLSEIKKEDIKDK